MTDREVMKQALDALKKATKHLPVHFDSHFEAITALRAQLEQPKSKGYTRAQLNEFEQIEDGTWEADRND